MSTDIARASFIISRQPGNDNERRETFLERLPAFPEGVRRALNKSFQQEESAEQRERSGGAKPR